MGIRKFRKQLTSMIPDFGISNLVRPAPINVYDPADVDKQQPEVLVAHYTVYNYDQSNCELDNFTNVAEAFKYYDNGEDSWVNVDGLKKVEVQALCDAYHVHPLIIEDVLSIGQRAKLDEIEEDIFCLIPMIYFNETLGVIEQEQVSIVLGDHFLLSFQEDPVRDVLNPARQRLTKQYKRIYERGSDYLLYVLLDVIVDSYYPVMDQLSDRIEYLENQTFNENAKTNLNQISVLRREVIYLMRLIIPVKDMLNGILRSEHNFLKPENDKYFKDVLDHATIAVDHVESMRDTILNLQDLWMNKMNLRMNETMRTFTIITTLLAPATVIGGVFGMNFDVIPYKSSPDGFYVTVLIMMVIPLFMLVWFRRKGWF